MRIICVPRGPVRTQTSDRALAFGLDDDEKPPLDFERYLETGSGREFARRHFRQTVRQTQQGTIG
jgi:hypothetical protein